MLFVEFWELINTRFVWKQFINIVLSLLTQISKWVGLMCGSEQRTNSEVCLTLVGWNCHWGKEMNCLRKYICKLFQYLSELWKKCSRHRNVMKFYYSFSKFRKHLWVTWVSNQFVPDQPPEKHVENFYTYKLSSLHVACWYLLSRVSKYWKKRKPDFLK